MAPPQVPPLASVAAKWRRRVEGASEDFKLGVQQKGGRWQAATDAASSSFKTAVSAGDIEARFKAGVSKAGNAKYQRRSEEHTSELQSLAYLVCRLLLEK